MGPRSEAGLVDAPTTVLEVDGERYEVYELTARDVLGPLQTWVDRQYGDPLEAVRGWLGTGLSQAQEQYLLRQALELAIRPRAKVGTPEASAALQTVEGMRFLLWLAVRRGRPGFTEAEADALFDRLSNEQIALAFAASRAETVAADPKAQATAGATTAP